MTVPRSNSCVVRVLLLTLVAVTAQHVGVSFAQDEELQDEEPQEEEFLLDDEEFATFDDFAEAAPQMVGDFGGGWTSFTVGDVNDPNTIRLPIALAGASRRIKISENNQVTPLDRVFATYNHFHNSFTPAGGNVVHVPGGKPVVSQSIDQYTIGIEKTLGGQRCSVELRMPFTGGLNLNIASNQAFGDLATTSTNSYGNLAVNVKALVFKSCWASVAGGLGISAPTGSDVLLVGVAKGAGIQNDLLVHNDALHLMPWFGFHTAPGSRLWLQGFLQVDVAANGNRVTGLSQDLLGGDPVPVSGRINEQTLLYLDLQGGFWLYRNTCRCTTGISGLAAIAELHYTTTLNGADGFDLPLIGAIGIPPGLGAAVKDDFGVLNLTTGLRCELANCWGVNVAGVFPLGSDHVNLPGPRNRCFDAEVVLQINRTF